MIFMRITMNEWMYIYRARENLHIELTCSQRCLKGATISNTGTSTIIFSSHFYWELNSFIHTFRYGLARTLKPVRRLSLWSPTIQSRVLSFHPRNQFKTPIVLHHFSVVIHTGCMLVYKCNHRYSMFLWFSCSVIDAVPRCPNCLCACDMSLKLKCGIGIFNLECYVWLAER